MEEDTIISLACSMHAKKGIYALLLGSGISRDAGIPTGWEIINKLIEKIAGHELPDPSSWYGDKYGKAPNYSDIVAKLGRTPTERSLLLREYFEPREGDEENTKKPTKAHRSIAHIIKKGYIKVVLTTNFDRLLEQALYDEGITPDVIANTDQIEGAYPLVHSDCLIVKIHGDYMDAQIRNTEEEVSNYPEVLNNYLDRILDEFGLIILRLVRRLG